MQLAAIASCAPPPKNTADVPDATGRLLGCNRSEAAKAAGELVGARFDIVPSDTEPAPGTDYVKFAGLVDVYDVDDCTQEVMS